MPYDIAALLFAAGIAGGLVNAIAGGATLITFPAMLAAGLPPVSANASNAVAVAPGHLIAAVADRGALPPSSRALAGAVLAAIFGGGLGALLLLSTPPGLFTKLVPALVALATLIFAFAPAIQRAAHRGGNADSPSARRLLLAPCSVYGGYFGAGLGVMILALISVTGRETPRAANALKNLLASAVSAATILLFALGGAVRWPETLTMLAGALLGGVLGARLSRVLPAAAVRVLVIAIGAAASLAYARRDWF